MHLTTRAQGRLASGSALVGVALLTWQPVQPGDTWLYAATGRWIADHHAIPRSDPFTWAFAGRTWQSNGWLWGLLLWAVWSLGGYAAVAILKPLAAIAIGLGVRWAARQLGAGPTSAAAAMVAAPLLLGPWIAERPQLASYVLLPLALGCTARATAGARLHPRWVAATMLVLVAWANLHTAAVGGMALVAATAVGAGIDGARSSAPGRWSRPATLAAPAGRAALVTAMAGVATLANPWGVGLWTHARYVREVSQPTVSEWAPIWRAGTDGWVAAIAIVLIGALAIRWRIDRRAELALPLMATVVVSIDAVRSVPLLMAVGVIALASLVPGRTVEAIAARRDLANVGALAVLVAALILSAPRVLRTDEPGPTTPLASAAALPSGCRLANDYRLGNWVVWARPDVPVSIDGRNDLFGTDLGQLGWFESAARIPATTRELADLGVSCVLARLDSPLPAALRAQGWTVVGSDDVAVALADPRG